MRIVALVGIIVTVLVKTHKMFEKRSGIKKNCPQLVSHFFYYSISLSQYLMFYIKFCIFAIWKLSYGKNTCM